jgi:hypothetical protein
MKKTLVITALASVIGLTGFYQASAYKGSGGMRGCGCNEPAMGMQVSAQMDEATKAKFDVFYQDTQNLRKSIAVKRAQKRALMNSEEPDIRKVGELTGELFDLRVSMRTKAEAAGLGDIIGKKRSCGKHDSPGFHHGSKEMTKGKCVSGAGGQVTGANQ